MMSFWIAYFSIGLYLIMPGIVKAWDTVNDGIGVKIIGALIAVLVWPVAFLPRS